MPASNPTSLAPASTASTATAVAQWLAARLSDLPFGLCLQWPGAAVGPRGAEVRLRFARPPALAWLAGGDLGALAEAYVRGDLDIDGRLDQVMAVAAALAGDAVARGESRGWLSRQLAAWRSRWLHRRDSDARHVRRHYDLSDEFFALWLDPARVYSCAYYARDDMNLAQAQQAKLELVCRKLQLAPGQRFLDIGAGWGGLLLRAAEHHGVHATGITLSKRQFVHVRQLVEAQGLRGRVEIHLRDYRDLDPQRDGTFDRIASIGMCEHVGAARLDGYFAHLSRLLRPGGLMLNHGIAAGGLHNRQLGAGMGDFMEKYIFPGGELVHVSRTVEALSRSGLELLDAECLRPHYARTLWAWSDALEQQRVAARVLTSEPVVRAYRLYLAGAAMCFERGWLSLYQLLMARPSGNLASGTMRGAQSDYPFRRRYLLGAA